MLRFIYVILMNLFRAPYIIPKMRKWADHPEKYSEEERYKLVRHVIYLMKRSGKIKTVAYGEENLPKEGGYVMYPNHQGKYDALGIISTHKEPCSLVMDEAKSHTILVSEFVDLLQGKRLIKDNVRQALKIITEVSEDVKNGKKYILFPEGGTTNMVNGNICLQDRFLKLPKMQPVKIKLHRMIPEGWKLKSVTVSREPSGKYFASLLFDCENQTAEKRQAEKFLGMDFAMHGMCVFSTGERAGYPMFYRNAEKKLAREQRKLSRCEKGSRNYQKQKKKVALYHEKIKNQRKDFQHKLSHSLAEDYDAVCVEDLNLKGMAGGLHFGKGIQDNGYGQFLSMLGYKLEERGKYLIKVDRYFASSKICSVCGHKKKELALSERIYLCECGNRMDRDVNAAVNILEEGKRIYKKCA